MSSRAEAAHLCVVLGATGPTAARTRTQVVAHTCPGASPHLYQGKTQPEPNTSQPRSHVSAADKLCMQQEDLCVTASMNGCVHLLHVHTLGLLGISVSNSAIPENLPALHHSRGLKRPRPRTNTCVSLHNYTCTGTSNPPPPLPQCLLFVMHHELTPPVGSEEVRTRRSLFKEASLKVARSEGKYFLVFYFFIF